MDKKFENRHSDDPDSLTTDDREVLKKKDLDAGVVSDALDDKPEGDSPVSMRKVPENLPKLILSALLVLSGVVIAVATSISVIGIVIGAIMVIAGLVIPFANFGAGAGRRDTA